MVKAILTAVRPDAGLFLGPGVDFQAALTAAWVSNGQQEREGLGEGQQDSSALESYRKGTEPYSFYSCKDSVGGEAEGSSVS